ncbi:hypothetical protein Q1695_009178 [Nippostrongylus brasiliensis]|nr:hypothetical protein Q1695_009178 [Nippostrongylus brasiliensis]
MWMLSVSKKLLEFKNNLTLAHHCELTDLEDGAGSRLQDYSVFVLNFDSQEQHKTWFEEKCAETCSSLSVTNTVTREKSKMRKLNCNRGGAGIKPSIATDRALESVEVIHNLQYHQRRRFLNSAHRPTQTHHWYKTAEKLYRGNHDLVVDKEQNKWQVMNGASTKALDVTWESPCNCDTQRNTHCQMCDVCTYAWNSTCHDNRAGISCPHRNAVRMICTIRHQEKERAGLTEELTLPLEAPEAFVNEAQIRQDAHSEKLSALKRALLEAKATLEGTPMRPRRSKMRRLSTWS